MAVITPADMRENVPAYGIDLNPDTLRFEARPVNEGHGPVVIGTLDRCIRTVAAEQGWDPADTAETVAYNAQPR